MISEVERIGQHPQGIRISELINLSGCGRLPEQKVCPRVQLRTLCHRSCIALLARGIATEGKRAAHGLERSTLWLEVIELLILVVNSKAKIVCALQPRHVAGKQKLIVAEQEGVLVLSHQDWSSHR